MLEGLKELKKLSS